MAPNNSRGWGRRRHRGTVLAATASASFALMLAQEACWLLGAWTPAAHDHDASQAPAELMPAGRRSAVAALAAASALAFGDDLPGGHIGSMARADIVKGNAVPKGYGLGRGFNVEKSKCGTVDECKARGEEREKVMFKSEGDGKLERTKSGARYKDLLVGIKEKGVAENGTTVQLRYKVMRQGKRANDGVSGEASTIFSLGFGEDDGPKDAVLTATLGEGRLVKALDEGIIGMAVNGTRRIQVRPDYGLGWKKAGKCAESSAVIGMVSGLPAAGTENEETCLSDLLPQPLDYGAKRRFARRFDESLIVEALLVGVGSK